MSLNILIIKEEIDKFLDDHSFIKLTNGQKKWLEREWEGDKLSHSEFTKLTPWLWNNQEIKNAQEEYDKREEEKIPVHRHFSMDVLEDSVYNNIRINKKNLYGFKNTIDELSRVFNLKRDVVEIELGKLIKNRLNYNIIN